MILRSTTSLDGLATMLSEFSSSCYDHGVLATHVDTMQLESCDLICIMAKGNTVPITGFDAFDEDETEQDATARIATLVASDCTIVAGAACISIGSGRPFVRASRPTRDVLVIETGGALPSRLLLIVNRSRGIIDTGIDRIAA